ncbi:AAA ATPase-like protein [Mariniflexile fucanivorans]|uniref:AAA ATPase-like protein n=1 Tax=Mariniflexile fucanivorans TaxID=264023 RepID=A0A4R1RTA7_9FLAO|nr:AAA family ATPase [Mariniflexile fucanivorans]TCL69290.1 AAA ATPase-like protein [Mariniflexile fucanivorans]
MITKIGVQNFKLFKDEVNLEIKPLTVLTGANNSGKSSFISFIRFIFRTYYLEYDKDYHGGSGGIVLKSFEHLFLNEYAIKNFGDLRKFLSKNAADKSLTFSFTYLANKFPSDPHDTSGMQLTAKLKYTSNAFDAPTKKNSNKVESEHLYLNRMAFYYENKLLFSLELHQNNKIFEGKNVINADTPIWRLENGIQYNNLKNYICTYWKEQRVKNGKKDWQTNFNKKYDILLPSHFIKIAISNPDFFSNEFPLKSYERGLLDYLIENGIKNHDELLIEYFNFESQLINQIISRKFSNLFKIKENDILMNYEIIPLSIKEAFEKDNFRSKELNKFYEEQIKSINSPIVNLVLTEILSNENIETKPKGILMSYLDNKFLKPNSKLDFNDIHLIEKLINWTITQSLDYFEEDLTQFLAKTPWITLNSDLPYVGQDQSFKSTFYENESEPESSILYQFGGYYFQFTAEKQLNFINKWLQNLNIADELIIYPTRDGDGDIIKFTYKVIHKSCETNIEDLGLGSRKLLLILMQLAMNGDMEYKKREKNSIIGYENIIIDGKLIILEEPESNLHPSFQSKLADIIIDAYRNLNVKIVVETHSEYLIRKLQYLVASKQEGISKNDIAIYYFYNPNEIPEGENQIYQLDLREDGFMNNDFGSGFFDEASSLSLRLINSSNFN